jgi:Ras-related protein Rab-4B
MTKENCVVCVIGNKCDLNDERCIRFNEGARFSQDNNCNYFECSAITGENINEAFMKVTKNILIKVNEGKIVLEEKKRIDHFVINEENYADNNKGNCYC